MRQFLTILALGVAGSVATLAGTTCTNLTNNNLLAIGNCTWTTSTGAVLTLSNFTLINNNGSGTANVTTPNYDLAFVDSGTALRLSFTPDAGPITANSTVNTKGGVYQFQLLYSVVLTTPGTGGTGQIARIDAGLSSSNVTGNGSVQMVKSFGNGGNISLLNSGGTSSLTGSSTAGLPSPGSLTIIDSVNLNGGNNGAASATLNSFYNQINVTTGVPEPVSLSLVGLGLVGMGLLRRHSARR